MNLLLDPHILIWWAVNSSAMPPECKDLLADPRHQVFFSSLSIWEVAIKHGKGLIPIPSENLREESIRAGLLELPFSAKHACRVETLPSIHANPFDRGLISQALDVPLLLVSQDEIVQQYPLNVISF